MGKVAPVIEYPVPVSVAELTVTAAVPEDVSVRVWVDAEFSTTLPNAIVPVLMVN